MSLIDIDLAMKHLLAEPDDQDLIQSQLDGAELSAMAYLNRNFYADQEALDTAKAAVPEQLATARTSYTAAVEAANQVENQEDRKRLLSYACQDLAMAQERADAAAYGIVLNADITTACLLKLGRLFADREDDEEMPVAAKVWLDPYRVRMGV
ncbi:hypothetical protein [Pseudomonas sp. B26(2017)]|uniref:hypothetical protein n=1 Tax=Pseudomonas sp. B26(2017) TaxID=1981732 RepID=UPI000A1D5EBC|nr:hypothetical protein [Pseudomonas sp. B26(2017)]